MRSDRDEDILRRCKELDGLIAEARARVDNIQAQAGRAMETMKKLEALLHDHDKTVENPAENAGEGQDFARTEKE